MKGALYFVFTLISKLSLILALSIASISCLTGTLTAQTENGASLVSPFIEIPPFSMTGENDEQAGFLIDMAREIGAEISVPVTFVTVQDSQDFVQGQAAGQTQLIAGVARLPLLEQTNVFSDPIAQETLRLVVLSKKADQFHGELSGLDIGVVPPAVGSEAAALLARNREKDYLSPQTAIMALISEDVDAILLPNPVAFAISRTASVDDRIVFIGPPLRTFDRYVALHQSRADLLPAVNAAIARMEADGRLPELRQKYFLALPPAPTDVFTVGVAHFPPHIIIDGDNSVSGFIPDALRDIARLADFEIEFIVISGADYVRGPVMTQTDLVAGLVNTPERRELMDFSYPIRQVPIEVVVDAGSRAQISTVDDLKGLRVGALEGSIVETVALAQVGLDVVGFDSHLAALDGLLAGEVDAAIAVQGSLGQLAEETGVGSDIRIAPETVLSVDTAFALRFGLGELRERMNVVIPGYLLSPRYRELESQYYGARLFWTPARLYGLFGLLVVLTIASLTFASLQSVRRRADAFARQKEDLLREKAHSVGLAKLIEQLETTNREQAEFTYAVSHDLKSPTNTMGMLIRELEEFGSVDAVGEKILSDMTKTNTRMGRLIEDVLHYSRVVGQDETREEIDLEDLLESIRMDLSAEISAANASVVNDPLPHVRGNAMQLRLLLQNLISNAIKFRSDTRAPQVHISASASGKGTSISVTDNGIGIPANQREKVFGLFNRLHTQSAYAGSGLGLAICRRVMLNHGGSIAIHDGIDGGTEMKLTFGIEATA